MNIKKIVGTVLGIGDTIVVGVLLKSGLSKESVNIASKIITEPEKTFGGVPLSKLTELAKEMYHGLHCTIDEWGFLIFHYKSNRGHQTFHTQMTINETGKVINLGGHYPGQWKSTADEFAKKANELFEFTKGIKN